MLYPMGFEDWSEKRKQAYFRSIRESRKFELYLLIFGIGILVISALYKYLFG